MRQTLRIACIVALFTVGTIAHADIAEQRRRLPPAAAQAGCTDALTGDWKSQFWTNGDWLVRTLRLSPLAAGSTDVRGVELIEVWNGRRDVERSPTCVEGNGLRWYTGESPLIGTFDGTRLDVRATGFELGAVRCGVFGGYVPDHFRGVLESAGTELHTRNDDGSNPETTVVFRRVTCGDGSAAPVPPPAAPSPPVTLPPREASGCSSYIPGL